MSRFVAPLPVCAAARDRWADVFHDRPTRSGDATAAVDLRVSEKKHRDEQLVFGTVDVAAAPLAPNLGCPTAIILELFERTVAALKQLVIAQNTTITFLVRQLEVRSSRCSCETDRL